MNTKINPDSIKEYSIEKRHLDPDVVEEFNAKPMMTVTYAELVELRDNGELIAGMQYRITDYVTTTSRANTQSAEHQFDIIVLALTNNSLSEKAHACLHDVESHREATLSLKSGTKYTYRETKEVVDVNNTTYYKWDRVDGVGTVYFNTPEPKASSVPYVLQSNAMTWSGYYLNEDPKIVIDSDTYFYDAAANLSAWQIWYSLDNDTERFDWADTENGKGVIYRMIDEWNNDCPYDFKNIQLYRDNIDGMPAGYYYTFHLTTTNSDRSLSHLCTGNKIGKLVLDGVCHIPTNVFVSSPVACKNNILGEGCTDNIFHGISEDNVLGFGCVRNTFGSQLQYNVFGAGCSDNTFGNAAKNNVFGDLCSGNTFGNNFQRNTLGADCSNNTFGSNANNNRLASKCQNNTFGVSPKRNTLGAECSNNQFGSYACGNTMGDNCQNNVFGNYFQYNTLLKFCESIICEMYYCTLNTFANGVSFIKLLNAYTASSNNQVKNYIITEGVKGNSSDILLLSVDRNNGHQMYISKTSSDEIKKFCLADLTL